ncbi:hypothetical protein AGDE_04546 [Angomonas deanei]|nr:hypothetical protein AGDE_04546 [Angomonas deanei]|eukprot:EPY39382.1 hypothetical protein AGDE_04546 [Angomonas deanei]
MSSSVSPVRETACVPPSHEEISSFVYHYSGKKATALDGPPPAYCYSGCDYALVLHASFQGSHVLNLSHLCWSLEPLVSQLNENLSLFCTAAKQLHLPGTPFSSLNPALLQAVPQNTFHHMVVQHWLYVVSRRIPPASDFDAVALRLALRAEQLGEPLLKMYCGETTDGARCCAGVREVPCASLTELEQVGLSIAPVPPFTVTEEEQPEATAVEEKAESAKPAEKAKPWLSYSKPWLLPNRASNAKKSAAPVKGKGDTNKAKGPWETAFVESSANLLEQFENSEKVLQRKRQRLVEVKIKIQKEYMTSGAVDYDAYATILKEIDC